MPVFIPQTVTDNVVVGAGRIMIGALDSLDASQGFQYTGDTPVFSLNAESENLVIKSSDGAVATNLIDIPIDVTYSGTVTFRNVSDENLQRFFMGESETVTQAATPVVDEAINLVQQGTYYQVGALSTNPSGVRDIGTVVITDDVPNPAFTVDVDYIVYADQGVIYIVPGGGIANDTNLLVDYTPVSNTRTRVKTSTGGSPAYELKFFPDNTAGDNREFYIPKCRLRPAGELPLKSRDASSDMQMEISIETRSGYAQIYADGVPV